MLAYKLIPLLFLVLLPRVIHGHPCEVGVVNKPKEIITKKVPKVNTDTDYERRIRLALSDRRPVTVSCNYRR